MKEEIEQILAEIQALKCQTEKEVEEARVRLLGKKGEITRLFDEFRTIAPEMKREFGQQLNVLKKEAMAKIDELRSSAVSAPAASETAFDPTMPGDPMPLGSRHPVSIALYVYLGWMLLTCITSEIPMVSFKFWLSKIWFTTSLGLST